MSGAEGDSCRRAAQAAIQVVREECEGMDVEVREMDGGMFMEIPSETAERMDMAGNSPVPLSNFMDIVKEDEFVRGSLARFAEMEGLQPDARSDQYAERVHTVAEIIFPDRMGFEPADLVGTDALEMVADTA